MRGWGRAGVAAACVLLAACSGGGRDRAPDGGLPDAGPADVVVPDVGGSDVGVPDAGEADVGVPDAAPPDAGDAGADEDAAVPDAGEPDAGEADAGPSCTGDPCLGDLPPEGPVTGPLEGQHTTIAADGAGRPHIVFVDRTAATLRHAVHDGTAWQLDPIVPGDFPCVVVDAVDRPHVTFRLAGGGLGYAVRDHGVWAVETVDADTRVGGLSSLVLDADGAPHVSYYDEGMVDVKYAAWTGDRWAVERVDGAGAARMGQESSLALVDGLPHVTYFDLDAGALRFAVRGSSGWTTRTLANGPGQTGRDSSLIVDAEGKAHVAHYGWSNTDLHYAEEVGVTTSNVVVDAVGETGIDPALFFEDGQPWIFHWARTGADVRLSRRSTDGTWATTPLVTDGDAGGYLAVARDVGGRYHLAWYDRVEQTVDYFAWVP